MMVVAVLFGWMAVVAGLLVSYHHDTAAGATMSGLAVAFFFLVLAGRELTTRLAGVKPDGPLRTRSRGLEAARGP